METKAFVCLLMMPIVSSLQLQKAAESQILGILKPADYSGAGVFPSYIADLLPEMIAASFKIKSNEYGNNDVVDTLMSYMPFARKIMAGQSSGGKLTAEQEKLMSFTEKVVPPMMKFVQGIYGGSSSCFNGDLPLNEIPDYDFTNVMLKMLPDISEIINQLKAKYGGWPGTDKSLEICNAFMPLVRKATLYQAELQGRQISDEEEKYLTFAEKVVPSIMEYSQALYDKTVHPGQENHIEQLVKSALEDLQETADRGNHYQTPQKAQRPVAYVQSSGHRIQSSQKTQKPIDYAYVPKYGG